MHNICANRKLIRCQSHFLHQWFTIWSAVGAVREEKLVKMPSIDPVYLFILLLYITSLWNNMKAIFNVNLDQELERASMPSVCLERYLAYHFVSFKKNLLLCYIKETKSHNPFHPVYITWYTTCWYVFLLGRLFDAYLCFICWHLKENHTIHSSVYTMIVGPAKYEVVDTFQNTYNLYISFAV